ncbi:C40 family peptidase [Pontibacter burrus]|uniref:C40 family peptidase n=1 Tax=Pontibacter burrus TaxID=2704466 RepID=A0A6B3LLN0_9BACT|nr:C40 family peptidase [Pontibacter burrus]NEM97832.1 C40 family peptidase [Pontibacter burrus]
MKKNLILFLSPLLLLAVLLAAGVKLYPQQNNTATETFHVVHTTTTQPQKESRWVSMPDNRENAAAAQPIINYALSLMGSPYKYAGTTPDGFDCSGFITHVFDKYAVSLPHSSEMQADEGVNVPKNEAAPGDLVIFTGTNATDRTPGHVGIVISEPGDTISFVHSSSNGGVKISKVQGTRYDDRYLQIRRVL